MLMDDGYVPWETFKGVFLSKYLPTDLCKQKHKVFLDLKQRGMFVGEYTTKFNELLKYWPQY